MSGEYGILNLLGIKRKTSGDFEKLDKRFVCLSNKSDDTEKDREESGFFDSIVVFREKVFKEEK